MGDVRLPWSPDNGVGFGKNVPNVSGTVPKDRQSHDASRRLDKKIDKTVKNVDSFNKMNIFKEVSNRQDPEAE